MTTTELPPLLKRLKLGAVLNHPAQHRGSHPSFTAHTRSPR